jgi:hypothetical protein
MNNTVSNNMSEVSVKHTPGPWEASRFLTEIMSAAIKAAISKAEGRA